MKRKLLATLIATAAPAANAAPPAIERCFLEIGPPAFELRFTLDVAWPNGKQIAFPAQDAPMASGSVSGVMTWDEGTVLACDASGTDKAYPVTGSISSNYNIDRGGVDHSLWMSMGYVGANPACTPTFFLVHWEDNFIGGTSTRWNHDDPNGFEAGIDLACTTMP